MPIPVSVIWNTKPLSKPHHVLSVTLPPSLVNLTASTGHGPQSPIDVSYADSDHAILKGLENWTTINEELYNNVRVFGGTTVLASGKQLQQPRKRDLTQNPNAKPKEANAVVVWTNEYGPKKTRIFSTTLGHNNDTVGDARYLDLITRGLLWTTGNLTKAGKPTAASRT